ncbi:MAG: caspase family protein [Planctomycetales bacterium]|nr:caspase family protein [Planctomycetales bacterium]
MSLLVCFVGNSVGFAAEPISIPQLRVETGMHTTLIRRVLPDLPRNRLITCSDDKTIRVWQMPQMRLLSVLRVPIDVSHEGRLYAVAVSPDGRTVAAGGWTGWDWDGKASIYFFDAASGELIRRLGGFDNVINALAWMPDGEHLAVGLQGYSGFRVLRLQNGQAIAADVQYKDDLMDMDISRGGRVVTTAFDGFVRLYDNKFKLIGRRLIQGGKKPISVRFSPNAEMIAVGFIDAPVISVISARDMSFKYHPDTSGISHQVGFTSVVWSSDGKVLYASGQYAGDGLNPVYRWKNQGQDPPEKIPLTQNRISEIQQMPDNHIAFAAEDPGVGVMGPDGKLKLFRGPDIANFSGSRSHLELSADASVVRYPLNKDNSILRSFAVFGGGDQDTEITRDEQLFTPILEAKGITVSDWQESFRPKINGIMPKLDEYEFSRSYAIAADGKSVLLGTEWAVRLLKPDASEIWHVKLPAVAWSVNISRNSLFAVAALSDGTIRWYRMRDGRETLSYFTHRNGRDWIAWVPDGYYMSSMYGDNYVGWHLNRGKDLTPDFYRAVQFDRILYRPDVVTASFRNALGPVTRSLDAMPQNADFQIARLHEIAPPRLRLKPVSLPEGNEGRFRLTLDLKGEKNTLAIRDYSVFVNHIPVTPLRERRLFGDETGNFRRTFQLDLPVRDNEIRVEAFNGVSMGIAETYIGLSGDVRPATVKGSLYMLAVGVNVFPALPRRNHLEYAAQDAEEFGQTWKMRGAENYAHINVHTLSDNSEEKPNREAIVSALRFVEQAGQDDTVVIFLASHGISDAAGNYYFVPRDVVPQDISNAQKGEKVTSLIPWMVFFDALRDSAGRRVLIVDTCQARSIEGKFEAHSLMKRSAASQFALIVASKGNEESQEYSLAKHGLFTYSLLNALKPDADANHDGWVSLKEVFDYAVPIVEELRYKQAGPQTPQMVSPKVLAEMPVMRSGLSGSGAKEIPIR